MNTLTFDLPAELEAGAPPEARGIPRDNVRLMVSHYADDRVAHTRFRALPDHLTDGDLLLLNTSGTLSAALPARRPGGDLVELHLSTCLTDGSWTVELRAIGPDGTRPLYDGVAGETLALPGGARATLIDPYRPAGPHRLWRAGLELPEPLHWYLEDHGTPIRYSYVHRPWPPSYYQTVYATEMGSAEMPSAGRAFSAELITTLVACGVRVAPLLLHTGVASLESHEPPYAEFYRVPATTARAVNETRAAGGRVIAVGTTAVRAIESVTAADGVAQAGEGYTELLITPGRGVRAVNGLLTGLHEPRATHLAMLAAICGEGHLRVTYAEALAQGYLWHEFGDLHLILP